MRYRTATAFRTALEERLRSHARQHDVPIVRLRKMVTFDGLLARLVATSDRWVLKGAMALSYRYGNRARTTMDLDLAQQGNEGEAQADLMSAIRRDLQDFFSFSAERVGPSADPGIRSTRYRGVAELAGRKFETIRVDVGFGDPLLGEPEMINTTSLLEFAGIEPVQMRVLPVEQHIAEKIHAYARMYRSGIESSRAKDLADLLLIATLERPRADRLGEAVHKTFATRGEALVPTRLPPPPESWVIPYRSLAGEAGVERDLRLAHARVSLFLQPVLDSMAEGVWSPVRWTWEDEASESDAKEFAPMMRYLRGILRESAVEEEPYRSPLEEQHR